MQETGIIIEAKLRMIIDTLYDSPSYRISVQHDPNIGYKVVITSPDPRFLGDIIGRQGTNLGYLRGLFQVVERKHNFRASLWVERNAVNI